MVYTTGRFYPY